MGWEAEGRAGQGSEEKEKVMTMLPIHHLILDVARAFLCCLFFEHSLCLL